MCVPVYSYRYNRLGCCLCDRCVNSSIKIDFHMLRKVWIKDSILTIFTWEMPPFLHITNDKWNGENKFSTSTVFLIGFRGITLLIRWQKSLVSFLLWIKKVFFFSHELARTMIVSKCIFVYFISSRFVTPVFAIARKKNDKFAFRMVADPKAAPKLHSLRREQICSSHSIAIWGLMDTNANATSKKSTTK